MVALATSISLLFFSLFFLSSLSSCIFVLPPPFMFSEALRLSLRLAPLPSPSPSCFPDRGWHGSGSGNGNWWWHLSPSLWMIAPSGPIQQSSSKSELPSDSHPVRTPYIFISQARPDSSLSHAHSFTSPSCTQSVPNLLSRMLASFSLIPFCLAHMIVPLPLESHPSSSTKACFLLSLPIFLTPDPVMHTRYTNGPRMLSNTSLARHDWLRASSILNSIPSCPPENTINQSFLHPVHSP